MVQLHNCYGRGCRSLHFKLLRTLLLWRKLGLALQQHDPNLIFQLLFWTVSTLQNAYAVSNVLTGTLSVYFSSFTVSRLVPNCKALYARSSQLWSVIPLQQPRIPPEPTNAIFLGTQLDHRISISFCQFFWVYFKLDLGRKLFGWLPWWLWRSLHSCGRVHRSWLEYYYSEMHCGRNSRIDDVQQWHGSSVSKQREQVQMIGWRVLL